MSNYLIVDVHVHTYATAQIGDQALMGKGTSGCSGTVEQTVRRMSEIGISRSIMVNMTPVADMRNALLAKLGPGLTAEQRGAAEREINANVLSRQTRRNAWSCQIAKEHPQLVPFIGLDPLQSREEIRAEFDAWLVTGAARGIKIHPASNRYYPNDRKLWPAYELAQEMDVPIIFHAGRFFGDDAPFTHPKYFPEVAEEFPKLRMILAHLCFDFFDVTLEIARRFPNVAFDCSAAISDQRPNSTLSLEHLASLIRAVGVDRVMFGSDFPWYDAGRDIERVLALPLSDAEKRMILGENALRICKL